VAVGAVVQQTVDLRTHTRLLVALWLVRASHRWLTGTTR
jgi:hypothetical protein